MWLLVPVALIGGFLAGWLVRQRLSLHYKQLWRRAEQLLEDKTLFDDTGRDQTTFAGMRVLTSSDVPPGAAVPVQPALPYVRGQWALHETHQGNAAVFTAIRSGFQPRALGRTANYQRFGALYRRDRENAENAVSELNRK
jgi:hypothetical protein